MKWQNFFFNKKYVFLASLGLAIVMFVVTLVFFVQKPSNNTVSLSREEVAQLVKPAVVRIVQHVWGTYSLPGTKINLGNLTFTSGVSDGSHTLDEFITGSGFIVSSDGYILTNAHVIAPEMAENLIIRDALLANLKQSSPNLTDQDIQQFSQDPTVSRFIQQVYDFIKTNANFNFQNELAVLNPSSSREDIKELAKVGIPAVKIDYDSNFSDNDKDVGLIKIAQNNLPTVELKDLQPKVGSQIYVFGFPSTADFNNRTPLESTFTEGVVSAIKNSGNKDFKIVETDAKISEGSSGGPMFNTDGSVEGIVTFQTDNITRNSGDNFAFAIPSGLGLDILQKNNINLTPSNFASHFTSGLNFLHSNECAKAIAEFGLAGQTNYLFPLDKTLNPYISSCQNLISSGKSLDTSTALWKNQIKNFTAFEWFVIIGRALLVSFGLGVLLWLSSKIRREEQELTAIESTLELPKSRLPAGERTPPPNIPVPEADLYNLPNSANTKQVQLQNYFSQARKMGLKDTHVIEDLKKVGWDDDSINEALTGTS